MRTTVSTVTCREFLDLLMAAEIFTITRSFDKAKVFILHVIHQKEVEIYISPNLLRMRTTDYSNFVRDVGVLLRSKERRDTRLT